MSAPIDILSRQPDKASPGELGTGRRSRAVRSALLGSVAISFLAACGQDDLARCIDRNSSEIVDVSSCDAEAENGVGGRYQWNFGGTSDDTSLGTTVDGGENIDPADQASISERGGFGANAQQSGTGVRELASSGEEDSDSKKKSSSSSGKSSGG
ncbi:hypothetical protein BH24ACT24_BH24ACT24_03380 [soil metagenome]|nr:hypothetical protein [Thermoleophilaceae bacterium]